MLSINCCQRCSFEAGFGQQDALLYRVGCHLPSRFFILCFYATSEHGFVLTISTLILDQYSSMAAVFFLIVGSAFLHFPSTLSSLAKKGQHMLISKRTRLSCSLHSTLIHKPYHCRDSLNLKPKTVFDC